MADSYQPPKVEKRDNAVEQQASTEQKAETQQRIATTPVDIYKNGIDDFVKFLKGEIKKGNLEERRKFQADFIGSVWKILELDYAQTKEILDYFVITISENKLAFDWNGVLAPLATVEGKLPANEVNRYKRFMLFITMLAEYARNRQHFVQNFDMTKFEAMFPEKSRVNLHTYVYR